MIRKNHVGFRGAVMFSRAVETRRNPGSELGCEGAECQPKGGKPSWIGWRLGTLVWVVGPAGHPLSSWLTCTAPGVLELVCFVLLLPTGNWPP